MKRPNDGHEPSVANPHRLKHWLFTSALPLWWEVGADRNRWGFFERIDLDGRPTNEARRARVQARQVYAYATAGRMGWPGPWQSAVAHGLEGFVAHYKRPDGLFRTRVTAAGTPEDERAMLYDQAFALLAFAAASGTTPRAEAEALTLLDAVEKQMRHSQGGFVETADLPFQSNPHMHLLEAALGWIDVGGQLKWRTLASDLVELALTRFIDGERGCLREFFTAMWHPAAGEDGRIVEPGHQFEWAWLLQRWAKRSGDAAAAKAAQRLVHVGRKGLDPARGVAIDSLLDDFSVKNASARLWPQTERLKATLLVGDGGVEPDIDAAIRGLEKYFDTEVPGLWRDKLRPDGTFVQEPAPASSLYHIVAAIEQLDASIAPRS